MEIFKTTSMMMSPMPPTIPAPTRMNTPAIFFSPSVLGVFSNCSHCCTFPWKIHSLSSDSMNPLSWKSNIANVTASVQGEPFCSPTPYPLRPNSSPAVTSSQSFDASYSSRDESQINAINFLVNKKETAHKKGIRYGLHNEQTVQGLHNRIRECLSYDLRIALTIIG
uniref:Uncharacterized protein n=1 Tax=Anopheles merus TaxID=30066 RepID=A0A182VBQ4_ANOME